jgi:hypothetical protein
MPPLRGCSSCLSAFLIINSLRLCAFARETKYQLQHLGCGHSPRWEIRGSILSFSGTLITAN